MSSESSWPGRLSDHLVVDDLDGLEEERPGIA